MAKVIACVEHQDGHITRLRTSSDQKTWSNLGRTQVVGEIELGIEYRTCFKDGDRFKMGAKVEVVEVGGVKYLRTDRDKTAKDNLGKLPSIAQCPV